MRGPRFRAGCRSAGYGHESRSHRAAKHRPRAGLGSAVKLREPATRGGHQRVGPALEVARQRPVPACKQMPRSQEAGPAVNAEPQSPLHHLGG